MISKITQEKSFSRKPILKGHGRFFKIINELLTIFIGANGTDVLYHQTLYLFRPLFSKCQSVPPAHAMANNDGSINSLLFHPKIQILGKVHGSIARDGLCLLYTSDAA